MHPLWNWQLPPYCVCGCCCCDLVEAQELGLLVVSHPWGDGCLQHLDPLGFFDFVAPTVVVGDGLWGYGLLEV